MWPVFHWLLYNPLWWPESGPGYALGSSWMGVNMGMFTIWFTLWRRHNCHEPRCLRTGRHVLDSDGHQQLYCHRHIEKAKARRTSNAPG